MQYLPAHRKIVVSDWDFTYIFGVRVRASGASKIVALLNTIVQLLHLSSLGLGRTRRAANAESSF
jgi:hypothetical protein